MVLGPGCALASITAARRVQLPEPSSHRPSPAAASGTSWVELTLKSAKSGTGVGSGVAGTTVAVAKMVGTTVMGVWGDGDADSIAVGSTGRAGVEASSGPEQATASISKQVQAHVVIHLMMVPPY